MDRFSFCYFQRKVLLIKFYQCLNFRHRVSYAIATKEAHANIDPQIIRLKATPQTRYLVQVGDMTSIKVIGHVFCQGHGIWHDVIEVERVVWMVCCGNCAYDYDDFCKENDCFMVKGETLHTKNDIYLEHLHEIESTHG